MILDASCYVMLSVSLLKEWAVSMKALKNAKNKSKRSIKNKKYLNFFLISFYCESLFTKPLLKKVDKNIFYRFH